MALDECPAVIGRGSIVCLVCMVVMSFLFLLEPICDLQPKEIPSYVWIMMLQKTWS
jgi:hypothetical protein